jgi:hypothetical protein
MPNFLRDSLTGNGDAMPTAIRYAGRPKPPGLGRRWAPRVASFALLQWRTEVAIVAEFMDVHRGMAGLTMDDLMAAHEADLAIQGEEGVVFKHAWADPESGVVYCLSEAPDAEAVERIHQRAGHPADEIHAVPLVV